jgi:predicted AAA+ superfamily ATPase
MYRRNAEKLARELASYYPCISINGPRQSGKTTLAKEVFPNHPYINFENPDTIRRAKSDWRSFLKNYHDGAIFDEVQHVPELLSYLQEIIDSSEKTGRFILTSSQNFLFTESVTQSLAGRVGQVTLLPLSHQELNPKKPLFESILTGGFPRLHMQKIPPYTFYSDYLATYLERDVRQLKNIDKLTQFQNFLRLCAGRIGQVVNFTTLAQDAGVSNVTAQAWMTILQASYIIKLLPPYHTNMNKRLVKAPKLYFCDTGLAAMLLEIESPSRLSLDKAKGHLVENFIILELLKTRLNQGKSDRMYFWRDYNGQEVDLIVEWGGELKAIEIKSTATFAPEFTKSLQNFCDFAPEGTKPFVIYTGDEHFTMRDITVLPFSDMYEYLCPLLPD